MTHFRWLFIQALFSTFTIATPVNEAWARSSCIDFFASRPSFATVLGAEPRDPHLDAPSRFALVLTEAILTSPLATFALLHGVEAFLRDPFPAALALVPINDSILRRISPAMNEALAPYDVAPSRPSSELSSPSAELRVPDERLRTLLFGFQQLSMMAVSGIVQAYRSPFVPFWMGPFIEIDFAMINPGIRPQLLHTADLLKAFLADPRTLEALRLYRESGRSGATAQARIAAMQRGLAQNLAGTLMPVAEEMVLRHVDERQRRVLTTIMEDALRR